MALLPVLLPGPVPAPFKESGIPPFIIVRVEELGELVRLHYVLESGGPPVNVRSKTLHETLPEAVEVSVGGWFGTMGQWSLLERYEGVVECRGANKVKRISGAGTRADFFIEHNFWRNRLLVTIESEKVGLLQVKCKAVQPMDFQTLVFDKSTHVWVEKKALLTRLGLTT